MRLSVIKAWDRLLKNFHVHDELLAGFKYGWDVSFQGNPTPKDSRQNHPSAMSHMADVDHYIKKELEFGALVGPLPQDLPFQVFASPLGSVPKSHSEVTRTITDCSQGTAGINAWINAHFHRGRYWEIRLPSTRHIAASIAKVRAKNQGCEIQLFKIDLSRYYRFWMVCPGQTPFFAIKWRGDLFIDRAFGFGNRAACLGAQRGSNAISWIYRTQVPPSPDKQNSGSNCSCSAECDCGENYSIPTVMTSLEFPPRSLPPTSSQSSRSSASNPRPLRATWFHPRTLHWESSLMFPTILCHSVL